MKTAYHELLDRITVTEAMRQRILKNLEDPSYRPKKASQRHLALRWCAIAAYLALLIAGASLQFLDRAPSNPSDTVQEVTPQLETFSSAQALSEAVGFPVEDLTTLPFSVTEVQYTAYGGSMAQITCKGDGQTAVFRKAAGTEDPSGDYTQYAQTLSIQVNETTVTLKGENGAYLLATWHDGTYSCSLQTSSTFSQAEWEQMLQPLC